VTAVALPPLQRLPRLAAAWALIVLAGPGFLGKDGAAWLAPLGVAAWGLGAVRPGPRAFLCEALVGGAAWAVICSWAAHVWWGTLLWMGPGLGLYAALSGALLRRLTRAWPLALALPVAWVGVETLRASIEPPFGIAWMRLGTHLAAWSERLPALAGSARLWGTGGLSLVLAGVAGAWAAALLAWRARDSRRATGWLAASALPPVAAALAGLLVPAPATVDGPRVLLVQPGIPQQRKMESPDRDQLFAETRALTLEGLARAGDPAPDLVVWGETMLYTPVVQRELVAAAAAGEVRPDAWLGLEGGPADLARLLAFWLERERVWVDRGLFDARGENGAGAVPPGAAFVSGAEYFTARAGRLRRQNAVVLWTGPGERATPVGKRHLVPGAETLLGLERFGFARDSLLALASYVPDLLPGGSDMRQAFTARDGRRFVLGASVCFDNAFDDLYVEAARAGIDFHLVLSNEAWFEESQEFDQMIAFSRGLALATGRSVVRATNSGISAVIDARGRVTARLAIDGRDRAVRGTLAALVPIPAGPVSTPYLRLERVWTGLWLAAPLGLLLLRRRVSYQARRAG
jgi:apolipoprotein N-acyltransferase